MEGWEKSLWLGVSAGRVGLFSSSILIKMMCQVFEYISEELPQIGSTTMSPVFKKRVRFIFS